ncbi:thiamine biosynthesis protein [Corynebacterium sp. A21]|uniref:thiamine biosynthesis protein n=1 Tax=Corynebacterium sp. A21 TaxID=3457318 RepID=UPI003FD1E96D
MKNRLRILPAIAATLMLTAGLSACSTSEEATDGPATGPENSASRSSATVASEGPESPESSVTSSSSGESLAKESSETPTAAEPVVGDAADSAGIALGGPGEAALAGAELVDISATPYSDIKTADQITLQISGLNPELGYHAAICAAEQPQGPGAPNCTGGSVDSATQIWLKNEGGTDAISPAGTAEFTLDAATTGEGLDCHVDACVIKVFGDHAEGFRNVADLPVSFAAA